MDPSIQPHPNSRPPSAVDKQQAYLVCFEALAKLSQITMPNCLSNETKLHQVIAEGRMNTVHTDKCQPRRPGETEAHPSPSRQVSHRSSSSALGN
jgi:hypothetical protein